MVSRAEEAMRSQYCRKPAAESVYQKQQNSKLVMIQCNKGKASKFKRSTSDLEADGASSAILLLACIACAPPLPSL